MISDCFWFELVLLWCWLRVCFGFGVGFGFVLALRWKRAASFVRYCVGFVLVWCIIGAVGFWLTLEPVCFRIVLALVLVWLCRSGSVWVRFGSV